MSAVDDYIARCDLAIAHATDLEPAYFEQLSREICSAFNLAIPNISSYREGADGPYSVDDIKMLRWKLSVYRDESEHELTIAKLNAAARGATVVIKNVGNNSSIAHADSTATANAAVTISQAIDAVDADPGLSEEQKAELQNLLAQAKGAVAKGDKGLFARIGSKIMEGVEQAAPALIAKVLEFLASQATGL